MKQKYFYLAVGLIAVLAIVSFTPSGDDPITALTKKVNGLQGQVTTLKNTVAAQKGEFDEQISDLETTVANQKQQINDALLKSLPIGSVIAFARDVTNLPSGWVLCDGRKITESGSIYNGYYVPDLRSHFIRGKGSSETILTEGGSNSHSHSIPSHNHEVGDHTHSFTTNYSSISYGGNCSYGLACRDAPGQTQYILFSNSTSGYENLTSHNHSGTTGNASKGYTASGGSGYTGSESTIPKYLALNYIIKIK